MATLKFVNINKIYDSKVQAVFDFNLDVKDKEFIVFVGPSGCGKSTTLRMVAGLEEITSGELYINDRLVNDIAPKDRDIAMVFQSYALYPHMTVFDNMAFGLKLRKIPKEEIEKRVNEAAAILGLEPYLNRRPKALSGGQRQRVALGRAIVRSPKVFLMDEPLSNLDAKLRVQMRSEIAKIHEKVGATTIYVTHDQTEAMTMATRIVIMKDGHIQQIGSPKEVYNFPANIFVGGFIGSPAMNFVTGRYIDGKFVIEADKTQRRIEVELTDELRANIQGYEGEEVVFGIRPEDIHIDGPIVEKYPNSQADIECDVVELLGHELILYGYLNGQRITVKTSAIHDIQVHDKVRLTFDLNKAHFFDPTTTNRLVYKKEKLGAVEEVKAEEEE
ncbi:MAG: sn-glycerol-3-phosphate ABC transporter ATP-binding protein UgpC [Bacilli bacterium]|nr:sn-glycerol-3-phosphate ABC transporter ATP-binding protein UgpC [Bacilli bacterium]